MNWDKPEEPKGKPCIHCGECCLAVTCALGQTLFLIGDDDVCPAIEEEAGLYYCGLVTDTAKFVSGLVGTDQWKVDLFHKAFIKLIGIGVGCTNGNETGKEHKLDKTFLDVLQEVVEEKCVS